MQPAEIRCWLVACPGDDLARAFVGGCRFALLPIGHRHDAKRQQLVNLGRIEEIARAFGSNHRVVVQNNRRRQHQIAHPR
jgi:hypothetical protein